MEYQSSTDNGSSVAQDALPINTGSETTKRMLRLQTWRRIQDSKCGLYYNALFNRIPSFVGSDKATALLADTEEFQRSEHIKINIDRALQHVKLRTLMMGKTLYLPATKESSALFLKVDVPTDATEDERKAILSVQAVENHRTEVTINDVVQLDMIVIGSVIVSRDGYRIGRGNGFNDLDIGLLTEIGSITPQTLIVTVVHDVQVADNLPINLFQRYDTPVDMIVTPKEVIRVANRLPRPTGIFWEILSERRIKIVPALGVLKAKYEHENKIIQLKDEDTDIEESERISSRRRVRRRPLRRNPFRRARKQSENEALTDKVDGKRSGRNSSSGGRFFYRRKPLTTSDSGVTVPKTKRQSVMGLNDRKQRNRRNRPSRDFCVKLSNISRDVRVKDLKTELRERDCHPVHIAWKGQMGKCFLHFGNRKGIPSTSQDIEKVMTSLSALTITTHRGSSGAEGDGAPEQMKITKVDVELMTFDGRKTLNSRKSSEMAASADVAAGGDRDVGGDLAAGGDRAVIINATADSGYTTAAVDNPYASTNTTSGGHTASGGDTIGGGDVTVVTDIAAGGDPGAALLESGNTASP